MEEMIAQIPRVPLVWQEGLSNAVNAGAGLLNQASNTINGLFDSAKNSTLVTNTQVGWAGMYRKPQTFPCMARFLLPASPRPMLRNV